ncbi:MAG: hypothetical protein Q7S83_01985 [bacterium]|nr:hypothetical protein [bacterium]
MRLREKIMYCAMPTRLTHLSAKVRRIAWQAGFAPSIPFDVGPFKYFEGGIIGRTETLRFMIDYMKICGTVGIFGISEGVMGELKTALDEGKKIRVFPGLDPEWDAMYEKLKCKYSDLFARLRGPHQLFNLVGAKAIGKTFWSNWLLEQLGDCLARVKNTTTRQPRDKRDYESYRFVTKEEFLKSRAEHKFLETVWYHDNYYGSSLGNIRKVLKHCNGICALTPKGAIALNRHRLEVNLTTILLVAKSPDILMKNFSRRKDINPERQKRLLEEARSFTLPPSVPHKKIIITGNNEEDAKNILKIVKPLIAE